MCHLTLFFQVLREVEISIICGCSFQNVKLVVLNLQVDKSHHGLFSGHRIINSFEFQYLYGINYACTAYDLTIHIRKKVNNSQLLRFNF